MERGKDSIDLGIIVSDIEASLNFYRTILGLEFIESIPVPFGTLHRLRFGSSDVKLVEPKTVPPRGSIGLESQLGFRYLTFVVKNLSKSYAIPLGDSLDKVIGDFWIIVHKVVSSPTAFILLPSEIRDASGHDEKDGNHSYWLSPKFYDQEMFREAWNRINQTSR